MNTRDALGAVLALCGAVALSACGGGGGSAAVDMAAPAATGVPDAALVSSAAYVSYTGDLLATSPDASEPLTLPGGEPPMSDTSEPAPLS